MHILQKQQRDFATSEHFARRLLATPFIDEVLRTWPKQIGAAEDVYFPSSWKVKNMRDIRMFALQGPGWASLDSHLNPWGDTLDDGAWDLITDSCVLDVGGMKIVASIPHFCHSIYGLTFRTFNDLRLHTVSK
jgi:hypothetical protein